MSELVAYFLSNLVWSLIVFVILFVAFTAAFARGQLGGFAVALGRVLLSIVTSPFVYMRKAAAGIVGYTREGEEEYRASDQYLLNKLMLTLQAVLIVAVVAALSASLVATWNAWMPPEGSRDAAREQRVRVEEQRVKRQEAATALAALDSEWERKRISAVARFRTGQQRVVNDATNEMTEAEVLINASGNATAGRVLSDMRATANRGDTDSERHIGWTKSRLDSHVNSYWYWLDENTRRPLKNWSEQWALRTNAQFQLDTVTPDVLRLREQPNLEATKQAQERTASELQQMESVLVMLDEQASLRWKAAALTALRCAISIFLFAWLVGVFIEAAWLAVRVAGDVRRIRLNAEGETAEPVAVAGAEQRLTVREPLPTAFPLRT
ncbi:MAG TPA: hypothetical protein VF618_16515 [Thermoanaerobaculia bacterium]